MSSFNIYSPNSLPEHDGRSNDLRTKSQRSSRLPLSPLNSNSLNLKESKKRSFHETTTSVKEKSFQSPQNIPLGKDLLFAVPKLSKQILKDVSNECPQQQILRDSCCSLYCLEVVSSAIIRELKKEARMKQKKLQCVRSSDDIEKMELVRATLSSCETNIWKACSIARDVRRKELLVEEKEDRQQRKKNRKEERRILRAEKIERRKEQWKAKRATKAAEKEAKLRQAKKSLPKNREMWSEIGSLMTDLNELQNAEIEWNNTPTELPSSLKAHQEMEKDENYTSTHEPKENEVQNAVDDITISLNRMNEALVSVYSVMDESETIRKELFNTYRSDHKFHGYLGVKNPKALIRALAFE